MSEASSKRKSGAGPPQDGSAFKKRKEGTAGRWKTPAQVAKQAERIDMGTALEVGDQGIWVTYARGMKGKAVREFKELCDEYGEKMYGIKPPTALEDAGAAVDDKDEEDIEVVVQRELSAMKEGDSRSKAKAKQQHFSPVSVSIECVFFMKTMAPVDPVQLVRRICQDARECGSPMQRKCRYINRMTPVVDTEKATDKGILKVARRVLGPHFELVDAAEEPTGTTQTSATRTEKSVSYAIRHNIRSHTVFESSEVIKMVAAMIDLAHKVNLGDPDKVILVEIFQMFCGMSVVDAREWEQLKRYNINALYGMTAEQKSGGPAQKEETGLTAGEGTK